MAIPANLPQDLTDLANRVMQKIGEVERFDDITTATTAYAVIVQDCLYDVIRDAQISFPWVELETFLLIETPEDFEDTTGYEFSYRYALPDNYLRPLNEELYSYRRRGELVYADQAEDLPFHYIRYDEDVTKWSAQLFKVVLFRVAEEVVLPITQSPELLAGIVVLREKAENEARRLASYNQRYPNQRNRARGQLSRLRRGYGTNSLHGIFNGFY